MSAARAQSGSEPRPTQQREELLAAVFGSLFFVLVAVLVVLMAWLG